MIYKNIELHNVTELETREFYPGIGLQRFPERVRSGLSPRGRFVSQQSSGCEIRFVSDSPQVRVSLSAMDADGEALVFYGDLFHSKHSLKQGVIHMLHLEVPPALAGLQPAFWQNMRFAPGVWRVMTGRYHAVFHGVDTLGADCRPPEPSEIPAQRWLAYGSSITHSAHATHQANTYVEQAAKRLGVDVLNAGLSGACLCEPEMADFLSERSDWDLATLEIGVNMRSGFTEEEFRERATYLIHRIAGLHPGKTVAVITSYPNGESYELAPSTSGVRQRAFDGILREIVGGLQGGNVHLLEGSEILTSVSGLTQDLIHPSDYGHAVMGEHLAKILRSLVNILPNDGGRKY